MRAVQIAKPCANTAGISGMDKKKMNSCSPAAADAATGGSRPSCFVPGENLLAALETAVVEK